MILPFVGSKNLGIKSAILDLPDPLDPTKATTDPLLIEKSISFNTSDSPSSY